ncbi:MULTISPECIES: hypothetical protein [unclassified Microbacterium]|uniref:hypothetical protein n=1 Tax=unclassified Microbacterium TaxID=2609290 RepID=UPI0028830287|nr:MULTISPECIES: hypothetical protein [unclassified Microbacterium]
MKLPTTARAVPDGSHRDHPELFGSEDGFELSTIRDEDASVAMELLVGGYASPIEAVIRELYINAADSHREAGQTRPVMITMPTEELPFFIVSDQGLGLDPEGLVGTFARPVASTKRNENLSAGGLGIGAKSPYTVTDRFTVHGFKNGFSATLSMARIDGQLKHRLHDVAEVEPGTPNGVTVVVPVEAAKILDWWRALARVHFWWNTGGFEITNAYLSPVKLPRWTKRLLGKGEPVPEAPSIIRGHRPDLIKSPQFVHTTTVLDESKVLMGQIAYAIPKGAAAPTNEPMVFHLPIGGVSVGNTREAIIDTVENRKVLTDLFHAWQHQQVAAFARRMRDPETTYLELIRIKKEMTARGLLSHFDQWSHRVHADKITSGKLPGSAYRFLDDLAFRPEPKFSAYGAHGGSVLQHWSVSELGERMTNHRVVFVDEGTLPEARRKILTRWANDENIVAVVTNRTVFEKLRFSRRWPEQARRRGWQEEAEREVVRPFARPEKIEWVDPSDIKVSRPTREREPVPDGASAVTVRWNLLSPTVDQVTTVDEVVEKVKASRHGWAIIDTRAKLMEVMRYLPGRIVTIATGQRPALLVRERLGKKALTVMEYMDRREEILGAAITQVQRRRFADEQLFTLTGVKRYFRSRTEWIEETPDPEVRAVAQEIARAVGSYVHLDPSGMSSHRWNEFVRLRRSLSGIRWSEEWFLQNSSLGKYAPAVFAAQSEGVALWYEDGYSPSTVALIRSAIASQLV